MHLSRTRHSPIDIGSLILSLALDILAASIIVGGSYIYEYKIPHVLPAVGAYASISPSSVQSTSSPSALIKPVQLGSVSRAQDTAADWHKKFKDKFSDTTISTARRQSVLQPRKK